MNASSRLQSSTGCQPVKHGPRTILLKLLTILLSGSPYQWWTRQQVTAGLTRQQSQLKKLTLHVQLLSRATNALTVELVGINQFQMFVMVNIKELLDLTSQSCNTRERALGSLPANRALNSDQVISSEVRDGARERASWSGPQATSFKLQAAGHKQQASSHKPLSHKHRLQATSHKRQAL